MKCDEMIMKPETVQEMKEMMSAEISAERYMNLRCRCFWYSHIIPEFTPAMHL